MMFSPRNTSSRLISNSSDSSTCSSSYTLSSSCFSPPSTVFTQFVYPTPATFMLFSMSVRKKPRQPESVDGAWLSSWYLKSSSS
uniref:Uncharacterized protein n=1 Tax=Anopheles atroparvus TaxID=41427 RepID=A0AAG5DSA4_ANOAO